MQIHCNGSTPKPATWQQVMSLYMEGVPPCTGLPAELVNLVEIDPLVMNSFRPALYHVLRDHVEIAIAHKVFLAGTDTRVRMRLRPHTWRSLLAGKEMLCGLHSLARFVDAHPTVARFVTRIVVADLQASSRKEYELYKTPLQYWNATSEGESSNPTKFCNKDIQEQIYRDERHGYTEPDRKPEKVWALCWA